MSQKTVEFDYELAGIKLQVVALVECNDLAKRAAPGGAMTSAHDGDWELQHVSVIAPDGEDIYDQLGDYYIKRVAHVTGFRMESIATDIRNRAEALA